MSHSTIVTVTLCDIARWTSVMAIIVMALCNLPEAFASDLTDDQSRYLFCKQLFFSVSMFSGNVTVFQSTKWAKSLHL